MPSRQTTLTLDDHAPIASLDRLEVDLMVLDDKLLGLDNVSHGVSVLMTGMPAGATAAILAARYESDAEFATKCVVLSTLLSMITLPVWAHIVG